MIESIKERRVGHASFAPLTDLQVVMTNAEARARLIDWMVRLGLVQSNGALLGDAPETKEE